MIARTVFVCCLAAILTLSVSSTAFAQEQGQETQAAADQITNPIPAVDPKPYSGNVPSILSQRELLLSGIAMLFGFVVLLIEYRLLRSVGADGDQVLKVVVVTIILVATMFIITAGYSSDQIAPAIGLFGTIAGYVLGRTTAGTKGDRPKPRRE